jgi:hypothetical protein
MAQLVLTSDTLAGTPATGTLEYNGQFFGTDSAASRAQMQRITLSTAVASTSGTSIDFTSIPAWVKRITVMLSGVSTSGTSFVRFQLGVSGTPETTGYSCALTNLSNAGGVNTVSSTSGFDIYINIASYISSGAIRFTNITGNTWVAEGTFGNLTTNATIFSTAGSKALAGILNMVRLTTVNGTDTFDAGSVNILYEG